MLLVIIVGDHASLFNNYIKQIFMEVVKVSEVSFLGAENPDNDCQGVVRW